MNYLEAAAKKVDEVVVPKATVNVAQLNTESVEESYDMNIQDSAKIVVLEKVEEIIRDFVDSHQHDLLQRHYTGFSNFIVDAVVLCEEHLRSKTIQLRNNEEDSSSDEEESNDEMIDPLDFF